MGLVQQPLVREFASCESRRTKCSLPRLPDPEFFLSRGGPGGRLEFHVDVSLN